jgi:hypothetical protein
MSDNELTCFDCGCGDIKTSILFHWFPYGTQARRVMLSASVPLRTCIGCGERFLDGEAESRMKEAVDLYERERDDAR